MIPLIILISSTATFAYAQYQGPRVKAKATTISEILKNPKDNQYVVIKGKLIKKISSEDYILSDGNAEIIVDIDNEIMPKTPVNKNTLLELRGKVVTDFMKPVEIDVNIVRVIIK